MDNFFPINIQTFLETVAGKLNPITERNLLPQDKAALLEIIKRKQQQNIDREFSIRNSLYDTPQEYRRGKPETTMEEVSPGKYVSRDLLYSERQARLQKQLESYEKTRGKTSISYGDYDVKSGENAAPVGQGWGSMIYQSIDDPAFRLAGTLGSFNAYDTPTGYRIEDKYKFNKEQQAWYNNASEQDLPTILKRYYNQPGSLGEVLFRKYLGDRSRNVIINLNKNGE